MQNVHNFKSESFIFCQGFSVYSALRLRFEEHFTIGLKHIAFSVNRFKVHGAWLKALRFGSVNIHIVWVPKNRRKIIYGKLRKDIGAILRRLCEYKGVVVVLKAMPASIIFMCVCPFRPSIHFPPSWAI